MKSILEIYTTLYEASKRDDRFINETFLDLVYKDIAPKLTVVDLGGFTGEFSFYCLPFAAKIYTVEPDPTPFKQLESYVHQFELEDKMQIFNFAIARENGDRFMDMAGGGGTRFVADGVPVKAWTLGTFMQANNIEHIDILKVDIEGGESEIFNSPEFTDLVPKIDVIIGEHNGFRDLAKHGYQVTDAGHGVFLALK